MRMFFVFSFVAREVREGGGPKGFRDPWTYPTRKGAERRRKELKKKGRLALSPLKGTRHMIRTEEW